MQGVGVQNSQRADREVGAPRGEGRPVRWHSRGYLPHFDGIAMVQAVTFRLGDSLPAGVLERLRREYASLAAKEQETACRRRIEVLLDAGRGSCVLGDPLAAKILEETLLYFDLTKYRMLAWCIMPNHVHTLIALECGSIGNIVKSWKTFSARNIAALKKCENNGRFWQREYWDRYIRSEEHFHRCVAYIEGNPVSAGLCAKASDWRWSSAWKGDR